MLTKTQEKPQIQQNKQLETKERKEKIVDHKQSDFQSHPSSYNGAQRENYAWTQSIKDIDVRVKVKKLETKKKKIKLLYVKTFKFYLD